jgi:hypothetical protein
MTLVVIMGSRIALEAKLRDVGTKYLLPGRLPIPVEELERFISTTMLGWNIYKMYPLQTKR